MKVAIIGSGITGLSAAWGLKQAGAQVTVFENTQQIGGSIDTLYKENYVLERGANSMLLSQTKIQETLNILGLEKEIILAQATKRFLASKGSLHEIPTDPQMLSKTSLLSLSAKLKCIKELHNKTKHVPPESIADFTIRHFGKEILETFVQPAISGIFAGDAKQLSIANTFPQAIELENAGNGSILKALETQFQTTQKPVLISFQKGLKSLLDALVANLDEPPRLNTTLLNIETQHLWKLTYKQANKIHTESFNHLIFACPAHAFQNLPLPPDIADPLSVLKDIPYAPLITLSVSCPSASINYPKDGFGVLFKESEKTNVLGVVFNSNLFASHSPPQNTLMTAFLGGAKQTEVMHLTDEAIETIIAKLFQNYFSSTTQPHILQLKRWDKAIPQYHLKHSEILEKLSAFTNQHPTLHIIGNFKHKVSIGDCLIEGLEAIKNIKN